jgi:hypothetical protein
MPRSHPHGNSLSESVNLFRPVSVTAFMFQKVDCVRLRVPNLEEGLRFYQQRMGHELNWRGADTEADRKSVV